MKKIYVFLYDNMIDYQFTFISHFLEKLCGKEVMTFSYDNNVVTSSSGVQYKSHCTIEDIYIEEVEALIIPGGLTSDVRSSILNLTKECFKRGRLIAAICAGPQFIARTGILKNVNYTTSIVDWGKNEAMSFKSHFDLFPRKTFRDKDVVVDQHVITAKGRAFFAFSLAILEYMGHFIDDNHRSSFIDTFRMEI